MKPYLLFFLLASTRAFGALDALTEWNVRTDGNDWNGGGFVRGATGTNYSQQAAVQFSGGNLVVDAVTNTIVSSATHNFVATDVGNIIQVRAGCANLFGNVGALTSPASTATNLLGDLEMKAELILTDWTPATDQEVYSKTTSVASGYGFRVATGGNLQFTYATGAAYVNITSTAIAGFTDATKGWIRVTVDVNNGGGGADTKFYTSTDGTTWTQLGATVTTGVITFVSHAAITQAIGRLAAATGNSMLGKMFYVQVLNGLGGTPVVDFDIWVTGFTGASTSSLQEYCGATWTASGTATYGSSSGNTSGFFQIVSVSANKATLDRSAGTLGSTLVTTGGNWSLGGAFATPGAAAFIGASSQALGTDIWIKEGTYTCQNSGSNFWRGLMSIGVVTQLWQAKCEGYLTTPGDRAGKPTIVPLSTASGVNVINATANGVLVNLKADGIAIAKTHTGIGTTDHATSINCEAINCQTGFNMSGGAAFVGGGYARDCTTGYTVNGAITHSIARGCTSGFSLAANSAKAFNCIDDASNVGFLINTGVYMVNCSAYGGSSHGFNGLTSDQWGKTLVNCVAYGRGGYGFAGTNPVMMLFNCAGGSNASGNIQFTANQQLQQAAGFITLSANPFVDAPSHNFALNNAVGGGRSLRVLGLWGTYGNQTTVGFTDIGAVQTSTSGGESVHFSAQ